ARPHQLCREEDSEQRREPRDAHDGVVAAGLPEVGSRPMLEFSHEPEKRYSERDDRRYFDQGPNWNLFCRGTIVCHCLLLSARLTDKMNDSYLYPSEPAFKLTLVGGTVEVAPRLGDEPVNTHLPYLESADVNPLPGPARPGVGTDECPMVHSAVLLNDEIVHEHLQIRK